MAPWWQKHVKRARPCARCDGTEEVHRGLCRNCRAWLLAQETSGGEASEVPVADEEIPPAPGLEPPHSRPWVHRGSGSG